MGGVDGAGLGFGGLAAEGRVGLFARLTGGIPFRPLRDPSRASGANGEEAHPDLTPPSPDPRFESPKGTQTPKTPFFPPRGLRTPFFPHSGEKGVLTQAPGTKASSAQEPPAPQIPWFLCPSLYGQRNHDPRISPRSPSRGSFVPHGRTKGPRARGGRARSRSRGSPVRYTRTKEPRDRWGQGALRPLAAP